MVLPKLRGTYLKFYCFIYQLIITLDNLLIVGIRMDIGTLEPSLVLCLSRVCRTLLSCCCSVYRLICDQEPKKLARKTISSKEFIIIIEHSNLELSSNSHFYI